MRIRCPQKTSHPPPFIPLKEDLFSNLHFVKGNSPQEKSFCNNSQIVLLCSVVAFTSSERTSCHQSAPAQLILIDSVPHLDFSRCLACSIHSYQYEERLIEIALIGQYITSLQSHWHNRRRQLQSHYKWMSNNGILNRKEKWGKDQWATD